MCSGATSIIMTREDRRHHRQDPAGDPAVRARDAHLPLDPRPLADQRGQVVEDLREVAAGFALRQDRGDEEPRVEQRHALARTP